jgi:hypothetical protein
MKPVFLFLALAIVGCGGAVSGSSNNPSANNAPSPVVDNNGGTVRFDATEVTAQRTPPACSGQTPAPSPNDGYRLSIVDKDTPATPWPSMEVGLRPSVVVGQAYDLAIDPSQPLHPNDLNAHTPDFTVGLSFARGSNQATLDPNAFTKATITIVAFPAKDGEPLTVRVQLSFSDTQTLDQTFSAPLVTQVNGVCGGG